MNGHLPQDHSVLRFADSQPSSHSPVCSPQPRPHLPGGRVSGLGRNLLLFPQPLQIPLGIRALSTEARETHGLQFWVGGG